MLVALESIEVAVPAHGTCAPSSARTARVEKDWTRNRRKFRKSDDFWVVPTICPDHFVPDDFVPGPFAEGILGPPTGSSHIFNDQQRS
jgi:hypothetical protein